MGTVINEDAAKLFERRVNDASHRGAKLLVGNKRNGAPYSPTVVDRVDARHGAGASRRHSVPSRRSSAFKDVDEAIRMVNGTAYGLSSGVCTNRMDYITRFVSAS